MLFHNRLGESSGAIKSLSTTVSERSEGGAPGEALPVDLEGSDGKANFKHPSDMPMTFSFSLFLPAVSTWEAVETAEAYIHS